ncbi:MAG TPA: YgiQ family radical SAM protein, partial [Haliea salexigens]|nr:YgiQ family radical SAM protein [Haliea salexigens]
SAEAFTALGRPNLFFGVSAGNMDSMINRYTADRKRRNDDAYTPGNVGGKRPDRAVIVYSQRVREAYRDVPLIIGSIEASLRRIAHYDYWSDKVRRSILLDSQADLLLYGNAERALVDVAHRLAAGEPVKQIRDVRGTAYVCKRLPEAYRVIDSTSIDLVGPIDQPVNPYIDTSSPACADASEAGQSEALEVVPVRLLDRPEADEQAVIRLPAY